MQKWYQLLKQWGEYPVGKQIQMTEENAAGLLATGWAKEITISGDAEFLAGMQKAMTEKIAGPMGEAMGAAIKNAVESIGVKGPRIDVVADEADKKKCFSDFLHRIYTNDREGISKVYGAKAALAEGSGTTGGYTVPTEFANRLLQVAGEGAIVRPRADIMPMASRDIVIPMLDQTTVLNAGQTPFFGGVVARWTGEAAPRTETEPQFKQVTLVAHELAGISLISRTLMQDSILSVDKLVTTQFGGAINWYEDFAFLYGDGVAKPKGVVNSPATIPVTRNTATNVKYVDVATMMGKLLPSSTSNACWVMSQTCLVQLLNMTDGAGRLIYMPNPAVNTGGAISQKVPGVLFGMPVILSEKLPPLGTPGDVILCDFSKYLIGDRQSIEIGLSEHYAFNTNQIAFRFTHRVDGQPWLDLPITYQDGSTQVSPFVKLV